VKEFVTELVTHIQVIFLEMIQPTCDKICSLLDDRSSDHRIHEGVRDRVSDAYSGHFF